MAQVWDPNSFNQFADCRKCIKGKDTVWELKVKRKNFHPGKNEATFIRITTDTTSLDWKKDVFDVPVSMKFSGQQKFQFSLNDHSF